VVSDFDIQRKGLVEQDLVGYNPPFLDGLWLRAPYLHNGSVPTLRDLLKPPAQRPQVFWRGYDLYDPVDVWLRDAGADAERIGTRYDTRERANGNQGHVFGTTLSPMQKDALLEYLKTLRSAARRWRDAPRVGKMNAQGTPLRTSRNGLRTGASRPGVRNGEPSSFPPEQGEITCLRGDRPWSVKSHRSTGRALQICWTSKWRRCARWPTWSPGAAVPARAVGKAEGPVRGARLPSTHRRSIRHRAP
jgi:hypothetical protein